MHPVRVSLCVLAGLIFVAIAIDNVSNPSVRRHLRGVAGVLAGTLLLVGIFAH
jgi:hypothetical protein